MTIAVARRGGTASGNIFDVTTPTASYAALELALLGEHQIENATAALALAEVLRERGLALDEAAIRAGLRKVRWPGRLQIVGHAAVGGRG